MNTKEYEFLAYEQKGFVGVLTLNRESKLNALSVPVLEEMRHFLQELHKSQLDSIKGLVFTGAGEKAFIAGADIASMANMNEKEGEEFASLGQEVSFLFEELRIPVIAAVNGFALGGGCEMALSCDFIYSTQNAVFGLPEVKLGLIPGFGGTQRLSKVIGRNAAKEMVFTGRNMKNEEAMEKGLVLKTFETKEQLVNASCETIKMITKNSPNAVGIAKFVMNEGNDLSNRDGLNVEKQQFSAIFSSYDMKEGCSAFVEKRKAEFKGK